MNRNIGVKRHTRRVGKNKVVPVRNHKRKIAVPPAWKKVQYHTNKPYIASGIDAKGRKQYIYSQQASDKAAREKYSRINKLEKTIPGLIAKVKKDINESNNPEAEVVYTMYKTGFRPGTDKDTKADKKAYGASNLLKKHVDVKGKTVSFDFVGKKGVRIDKDVQDQLLANIMKKRLKNPRLFDTSEHQLRSYFDKKTAGEYKLKDLRTLKAQTIAKKSNGDKKEVVKKVSDELGNTPTIALGSYIQPKFIKK